LIPEAKTDADWKKPPDQTTGLRYYNNDKSPKNYGKLYNWYAINDKRGLALLAGIYLGRMGPNWLLH
jgi:hypothetical protein